MTKLAKQAGIKLIVAELEKGAAKVAIAAKFGKQWQTPKDTFNKWYVIASVIHTEAQSKLNAIANVETIAETIDAKKRALNEQEQRKQDLKNEFDFLKTIAIGKKNYKNANGEILGTITTGVSDKVAAVNCMIKIDERLAKAEGTDAPLKSALTDVAGKDVAQSSDLDNKKLDLLLQLTKKVNDTTANNS